MKWRFKSGWSVCAVAAMMFGSAIASAADWTRFRGSNGTGIVEDKDVPLEFSPTKNILWKAEIPGAGISSPIISKGKVFLQTAPDAKQRALLCYDAKSGKLLWSKDVPGDTGVIHARSSLASSTSAADDNHIYTVFWDGRDMSLTAHDYDGNLKWQQALGAFKSQHGVGLSPMVVGDKVIINNDQDGSATLEAYDTKTGKQQWKVERPAYRACYSTPFVLDNAQGKAELIVTSTAGVSGYDPQTGKEQWVWRWKFGGMPLRTVCGSIAHKGVVYSASGDGGGARYMIAVKMGGSGDITASNLLWEINGEKKDKNRQATPYVPTMLAKDEYLFWVTDQGFATCLSALDGKTVWNERLGSGGITASPILLNGNMLAITEDGKAFHIKAGKEFEVVGKGSVGEQVYASPAVADGRLYIRGKKHLFCIATR